MDLVFRARDKAKAVSAPTPFNALRCFWALLGPTVCVSPFYTGMAKAGEGLTPPRVSPWMAGGRGPGWGEVVSWDGLTPRGHSADTFTVGTGD